MKFGLTHGNMGRTSSPALAREMAIAAEAAGFDSLWSTDHAIIPTTYEHIYPETSDGQFPFPVDHPLADPFPWLTWVAAVTERVKIGTAICVLPQRNVVVTAKETATVDHLSGGRLILGIGAGWLREEFQAVGADFETRGKRLREAIPALRALWTGEPATYHSDTINFDGIICQPTPAKGSIPIHLGGFSELAARRAGRVGDGFFPGGYGDLDRLSQLVNLARDTAMDAGRPREALEVTTRWSRDPSQLDIDLVRRLEALGVDRVTVPVHIFDIDKLSDEIAAFGEKYIQSYQN
ncbi:LLM class F420-dependent oxidoreductase [Microbacterium sp. E-13]|uniref:LLM class F420-dependent oxidoreductase n=1 Tax=Microbacterium sp. E-13 TaxID=3404048 RepID=UPI003CEEDA0D